MQIKRFEAKDMTTALKLIKKELGPEAVILSARSLKTENRILGSIKTTGVEVTAATDTYHPPAATQLDSYAVRPPGAGPTALATPPRKKAFMHAVQDRIKSFAPQREPAKSVKDHRKQTKDELGGIFQYLLSQGVRRTVAGELVEAVKKDFSAKRCDMKEKIIPQFTAALEEKRNAPMRPLKTESESNVLAFIGPAGVGKTTAVANVAARQAIQHNKKVALISIDSCRIAAIEELKVYGNAIGIPVERAGTPAALAAAIHEYEHYDFILVDTPGINANHPREIDDLNSYLEVIPSVDIHLLLSAGSKETDLFNIIERLATTHIQYLMFTKLDESRTFGNLINLLAQTRLPLSFISTGRKVPDSVTSGSTGKIVKYLFDGYQADPQFELSETPHQRHRHQTNDTAKDEFVANKNSDVFHYPDCKWTQKIKPHNMITFANVQDAIAQHFVPCRDCRPGVNESFQTEIPAKERVRISSYL